MELIHTDNWKKLATHILDPSAEELPPPGSIIYTEMEHVYDLFKKMNIHGGMTKEYILITANSDYSVMHQKYNPVWADMSKWVNGFVNVDENTGYNPVIIPSRCNLRFCKIDDVLSIKMYSYTGWTMNYEDIPECLYTWYSTNNCIDIPLYVNHIPFGIPQWNFDKIEKMRKLGLHKNENRKIPFLYSCSFNTAERGALYNRYKNNPLVTCFKEPLSHDDYIDTLLQTKFVLCPTGNGLDCYRMLEALYLGAVPIIINGNNEQTWLEPYHNTAIITNNADVDAIWKEYGEKKFAFDLDNSTADMLYWRTKIGEDFNKLLENL